MANEKLNLRETDAGDEAQQVGVLTLGGNLVGGVSVPSKLIAFYASSTPPPGWVEYPAARGRFIVGVPTGGTIAGTMGTALTNLQDKTHTHTGPSHTHDQNTGASSNFADGGYLGAASANGANMRLLGSGGGSDPAMLSGVAASGTGNTGTAATSHVAPYIQLFTIQKV